MDAAPTPETLSCPAPKPTGGLSVGISFTSGGTKMGSPAFAAELRFVVVRSVWFCGAAPRRRARCVLRDGGCPFNDGGCLDYRTDAHLPYFTSCLACPPPPFTRAPPPPPPPPAERPQKTHSELLTFVRKHDLCDGRDRRSALLVEGVSELMV